MITNNSPIYFVENNYESEYDLLYSLGISKESDSFLYLIENGYLKKNNVGKFAFDFVGLVVLDDKLVCVFPKYYINFKSEFAFKDDKYFSDFVQILKVLKKKAQNSTDEGYYNFIASDKQANEIIIADEIIQDFVSYGIYQKDKTEQLINSEGETDWETTINLLQPLFSKRNVIYSDTYSNNRLIEEDYIITQIHKWAVNYCIKKYSRILDYNIIFDQDSLTEILEIGSLEYLTSILQKELNIVYLDRSIRLIKLLYNLLSKSYRKKNKGISIYGTNTFYIIWEETCSLTFNNKRHLKICQNISTLSKDDKEKFRDKSFLDIIPKPVWWSKDMNLSKEINSTLIPDIVSIINNTNEEEGSNLNSRIFFTLDPKYYNLEFKFNELKRSIEIGNNPGISDVTKQILYEHVFKEHLNHYFDRWYNILLFPKIDSLIEENYNTFYNVLGNVKFELKIFKNNLVWLVYLNPKVVFEFYLNNSLSGENSLMEIANEIDKTKIDCNY